MHSTGIIALAALLTTPVFGHMTLNTPTPYGKSTLNNGPLAADGSDFPCKQRAGVYDAEGASNIMAIGTPQTLSFTGSAVHGGGSCQVSLTTDLEPNRQSKWMVIKSIEGGCPSSAPGNLPENAQGNDASTFQFTIPEGINPGEYTLAWTWFNKIGNREMYMNCAPATVTGAKKKRYNPNPVVRRQSSFPEMYVANLAGVNTCKTAEGSDYGFPNPGDDVEQAGSGSIAPLDASCMGGSGSVSAGTPTTGGDESGSDNSGAPSSTAAGVPAATGGFGGASSAAPSAPAATGGFQGGFGGDDTGAAPTASPAVFASAAPSVATVEVGGPPAATSAAAPVATGAPSTGAPSTSGSSSGGSCTPGEFECSADGKSFRQCTMSGWSVNMAMAQGTHCTPGTSASFAVAGDKMKRVVRRSTGLFEPYY